MANKIKSIIVHCSDSAWGGAKIITQWHTYPKDLSDGSVMYKGKKYKSREHLPMRLMRARGNGWRDIGYHWVICNGQISSKKYDLAMDGRLEAGRKIDNNDMLEWYERGAHAKELNKYSIGICLIGRRTFTFKQLETALFVVRMYKAQIPDIKIFGHYEVNDRKPCPNIDMDKFRSAVAAVSARDPVTSFLSPFYQ